MYRMCRPADRLFLIFSIFHSLLKRIDQPEEYRILFSDMFSLKKTGLNYIVITRHSSRFHGSLTGSSESGFRVHVDNGPEYR